jgi:hypothetical protein
VSVEAELIAPNWENDGAYQLDERFERCTIEYESVSIVEEDG